MEIGSPKIVELNFEAKQSLVEFWRVTGEECSPLCTLISPDFLFLFLCIVKYNRISRPPSAQLD